jgi:hypothetical protein
MKSKSLSRRSMYFLLVAGFCYFFLSCNSNENREVSDKAPSTTAVDSAAVTQVDTAEIEKGIPPAERVDSTAAIGADIDAIAPSIKPPPPPPPPPFPTIIKENISRGFAIVYCPTKMISNVPSIVNATISKEEFATAYAKFAQKIQGENPDVQKEKINRDIKGDSIDIFEKMSVTLEFDPDDFKQISKNDNQTKDFTNKTSLEWDWIIKPLHSTPKSIINFKFYYLDPDNKQNFILEKTISVSSSVDARSFTDKWADFLAEDPKTTITVILVPFLTFLGGFFSGRRKKAA